MRLRPRTRQVLDCLMQGMDISETAKVMGIARRSVKAHLHSLYTRYRISRRYVKRVRLVYLVLREKREHAEADKEGKQKG